MSGNEVQNHSLIEIDIDEEIKKIIERLDGLTNKVGAAKILKDSLDTATARMRKEMIAEVLGRYTFKKRSALNKESKIRKASGSKLQAAVIVKGSMREIKEFKFRKNGKRNAASAKVLKSSSMKMLAKDGLKAFIATFHNGADNDVDNHVTIVRRAARREEATADQKYSDRGWAMRAAKYSDKIDDTKISPIYSPSIPHMMGSQEVQEKAAENAYGVLQAEISKHIDKVLGQNGGR